MGLNEGSVRRVAQTEDLWGYGLFLYELFTQCWLLPPFPFAMKQTTVTLQAVVQLMFVGCLTHARSMWPWRVYVCVCVSVCLCLNNALTAVLTGLIFAMYIHLALGRNIGQIILTLEII